jgi:putative transposase
VFGKTRQAWYYHNTYHKNLQMHHVIVVRLVKELRMLHPRIGTRKLFFLLQVAFNEHQIKVGRDQLYTILDQYGLLVRIRKRRSITTNSNHSFYKYSNLIQGLTLTRKNQLWVSDITYIRLQDGFAYLNLITDAYSKKIVGYCLYATLSATGTITALNEAILIENPKCNQLIHHSDRGVQYCCTDYVDILRTQQIRISMSAKGDPYQNAIAERINGILKEEYLLNQTFKNIEDARESTEKAIKIYNHKRPHNSLNYYTPIQAHEITGIVNTTWKNYKNKPIDVQDNKK